MCTEDQITEKIIDAARTLNNGTPYPCPDEISFRLILKKGAKIGPIKNILQIDKKHRTQCTLGVNGESLEFYVETDISMVW